MNNQSPLIPSGSLLEQPNKGRTRVKIAVFLVLAIHGLGLMALLMQGCKKEDTNANAAASATDATNTPAPAFVEPTNSPPTSLVATPTNTLPTPPPVETAPAVSPPSTGPASEYVIVKGDTFSTIAKKFHVTVKALLDANPSVEPTKLKIGQSIHIPAAVMAATTNGGTGGSPADSTAGGKLYTVKSGDSLTKIAGEFGIPIRTLRSANNLKTDKIVVGQKLTIPAKSSAPPASSAPAAATPTTGGQ